MPARRLKNFLVLLPCLLGFAAAPAHAMEADLDGAWRDYANTQSHREPAYRFPYASSFGTAALQYDLPETLLLAV
ncbi:MAG TPA: hypothetical protein VK854_14530, partial [Woeseiaceae bacterium]|nr:hypothetical protein [Woeseiaceae bacterium]